MILCAKYKIKNVSFKNVEDITEKCELFIDF